VGSGVGSPETKGLSLHSAAADDSLVTGVEFATAIEVVDGFFAGVLGFVILGLFDSASLSFALALAREDLR
jgi:hypothetical protein